MWALVPRKTQVLIVGGVAIILAWGIEASLEIIQGSSPPTWKFISLVATIISFVLVGIVSVIWRSVWALFPWIRRKTFPDLNGTWEGHLVSTWINPETGQCLEPIPTTIWVRQGIFTTSIKLQTGESTSYSTRCLLEADHDAGRFRFWYSYSNDPKAEFRYRSGHHEGVAWLELDIDTDPERLVGYYYTERKTSGDIDVRRTKATVD